MIHTILKLLYFIALFICLITSLVVYKYNKGIKVFPLLMTFTLLIEVTVYILGHIFVINPFGFYHLYLPMSGMMMGYFFYYSVPSEKVKKILVAVIAIYLMTTLSLTFFFYKLTDFPGLSVNVLGFLLISISLYVLLTLDPIFDIPLHKHPLVWICVGMIVFYTGTFFLNGIYNYLVETKSANRVLIHSIINKSLDCFMYSCFTVGLICSHGLKKYSSPTLASK